MTDLYIITGAGGHLGSTIIRTLLRSHANADIRGLLLPDEPEPFKESRSLKWFRGNVTDTATLIPLFKTRKPCRRIVIHTAGIIDITASDITDHMFSVNVNGTKNMIQTALDYPVFRFIYVSSVHAIPEQPDQKAIAEITRFSPDKVVGGYAKTKALATNLVLESVSRGLPAIIVHPSGIIGPYDISRNHLVTLVKDYITGKLPACVRGGYDFVDVRDVALGTLNTVTKGTVGECYILSNKYCEVKNMLDTVKHMTGRRPVRMIPMWLARLGTPFLEIYARLRHEKPLYTKYSLYTLTSNGHFSHDKATRDLDYHPRSLDVTLKDTVRWLKAADRRAKVPKS